jgi:hypothetical protein
MRLGLRLRLSIGLPKLLWPLRLSIAPRKEFNEQLLPELSSTE